MHQALDLTPHLYLSHIFKGKVVQSSDLLKEEQKSLSGII